MKRFLSNLILAFTFPCMVWAALPFTDTFTGTDATALGTYSASWTVPYDTTYFKIYGNAVAPVIATAYPYNAGSAYNNSEAYANDQYAQGVITWSTTPGALIGPAVRIDTNGQGYWCASGGDAAYLRIKKLTYYAGNGIAYTDLATDTVTGSTGDTVRCEVSGTTITLKLNGATRITATDASYASGKAGIGGTGSETTNIRYDTHESGNITSAGQTFSFRLRMVQ